MIINSKPSKLRSSKILASSNEIAELRRMITHFRVQELQELLQHFGMTRTGRKQALQNRAIYLINKSNSMISAKIREINSRESSYPFNISIKAQNENGGMNSLSLPFSQNASQSISPTVHLPTVHPFPLCHMKATPQMSYTQAPITHSDVRFIRRAFFEELTVLYRPTVLNDIPNKSIQTSSGTQYESKLHFSLSQQQLQHITDNRFEFEDATQSYDKVKQKYNVQVQLRFCLNEPGSEQNDNFPVCLQIKVNGKMVQVPGYHPVLSNRPEYKRTGRPVDITASCLSSNSSDANYTIHVYWVPDQCNIPKGHIVMCTLVKCISSQTLLTQLQMKGLRSAEHSLSLIREKFQMSDSEISATSFRVSLLCPLGKTRMKSPCRSKSCTHLQCYDAELYLQMNEKKPTWICPVCDKLAPYSDLIIDQLFIDIILQTKDHTEVEFDYESHWYPIDSKGERVQQSTNNFRKYSEIIVDSPNSSKTSQSSQSTPEHTPENLSRQSPPKKINTAQESVIIDLTQDESDSETEDRSQPSSQMSTVSNQPFTNKSSYHYQPSFRDLATSTSNKPQVQYYHTSLQPQYSTEHLQTTPTPTRSQYSIYNPTKQLNNFSAANNYATSRSSPTLSQNSAKRHKPSHQIVAHSYIPASLSNQNSLATRNCDNSPYLVQTPQLSPDSTSEALATHPHTSFVSYPTSYLYSNANASNTNSQISNIIQDPMILPTAQNTNTIQINNNSGDNNQNNEFSQNQSTTIAYVPNNESLNNYQLPYLDMPEDLMQYFNVTTYDDYSSQVNGTTDPNQNDNDTYVTTMQQQQQQPYHHQQQQQQQQQQQLTHSYTIQPNNASIFQLGFDSPVQFTGFHEADNESSSLFTLSTITSSDISDGSSPIPRPSSIDCS